MGVDDETPPILPSVHPTDPVPPKSSSSKVEVSRVEGAPGDSKKSANDPNYIDPHEDVVNMVRAYAPSRDIADELIRTLGLNGLTSTHLLGSLSTTSLGRVTGSLSVAAAATLESVVEEIGAVIRKRRKLHAEADALSQRSTVQIEAIVNQAVKNYHSPLPPNLFYGISASVISAISNIKNACYVPFKDIMEKPGLDVEEAPDSSIGPLSSTSSTTPPRKSKSPESVADWFQCRFRFSLLIAGTIDPLVLSPVDVLAYGSRIMSLAKSLPFSAVVVYDDKYRRGLAAVVAANSQLTLRQCFLSDVNPTLLVEVANQSIRTYNNNNNKRHFGTNNSGHHPQKSQACRKFAMGTCTWGDRCRYVHDTAGKPGGRSTESSTSDPARSGKRQGKPPAKSTTSEEGFCVESNRSGDCSKSIKEASTSEAHTPDDHVKLLRETACGVVLENQSQVGYRDGTGLVAATPSELSRGSCSPNLQRVADLFLAEAKVIEESGLLSSVCGSLAESQIPNVAAAFNEATGRLVPDLCSLLNCSPRTSSCGSPVRAELGKALCELIGDPDCDIFTQIDEGLSLGVDRPLQPSGIFPAARSKAHINREMEVFNLKKAHRNFSSVEAAPDVCLALLRREVALGRMSELSYFEAQKDPKRLYARMAMIPKSDGSYRLIEDHTASSLNDACQLPETCSLPRACDLAAGLKDLYHTRSGLPPEPHACHKALPFGAAASPFHWCRGSASVIRLTNALLRFILAHARFLSIIYIDDGLLALLKRHYIIGCVVALLVWHVLNVEVAWSKCLFAVKSVKYIGFDVSVSSPLGPSVVVHPDIWASIRDLLGDFRAYRKVHAPNLAKVLGKLVFATQLLRELKGFLQPFYALLETFEQKRRQSKPLRSVRLSEESKTFKAIVFWLEVISKPRAPMILSPRGLPKPFVVGASDASIEYLAGWASDGDTGLWFRVSTSSPAVLSWVKELGSVPSGPASHRDIALYELLAAVATMRMVATWKGEQRPEGSAFAAELVLFCDNSAVIGSLKRLYSPSTKLAVVLQAAAHWIGKLRSSTHFVYIKSQANWLADSLSRDGHVSLGAQWAQNTDAVVAFQSSRVISLLLSYQPLTRVPKCYPAWAPSSNPKRESVRELIAEKGRDSSRLLAEEFAATGLAQNTNELYDRTVQFYAQMVGTPCFPLTVSDLQLFIWALTKCGYAYNTIKTYVSGLRSRNKSRGYDLSVSESFRLSHVLRAAEKACSSTPTKQMLPLNKMDIFKIFRRWHPRRDLSSAAILIGIFGLLRADEILALEWDDISIRCSPAGAVSPCIMEVKIRRSKTDQVAAGQSVYIACTSRVMASLPEGIGEGATCDLCPLHVLWDRKPTDGTGGKIFPLYYQDLLRTIRTRLGPVVGYDVVDEFGTHTLRRTGAQLLHQALPAESPVLMRAGRWKSLSVLEYLHESSEVKAKFATCYMLTGRLE
ncbi:hypothetical protein FOL47_006941 [Perkinsus chesapeaki]|uniref:C3H1-type domain-containing protein n=1 Tax=Perkinsus chesapeaki TaxID=330153 RepID=A0A7J6N2U5_PERCH|nr:hypothetical protein FOL47_006941 [Perkinsus chesapeaki]